jgi:hypothetical protein
VVADPAAVEVAVDLVGELIGEQVPQVRAGLVGLLEDAGPVQAINTLRPGPDSLRL